MHNMDSNVTPRRRTEIMIQKEHIHTKKKSLNRPTRSTPMQKKYKHNQIRYGYHNDNKCIQIRKDIQSEIYYKF